MRTALLLLGLLVQIPQPRDVARTLSEVRLERWASWQAEPELRVGEVRRMIVQVQGIEESWNPFLSRFAPARYLGLRAWSDEQRPWLRADYEAPAVRTFAKRGGELEQLLRAAQPHQRYELVLVARELCAGELWCEVLSARRLKKEIPEATVQHTARALELLERQAWELAASELEQAVAAPLPSPARNELDELARRVAEMRAQAPRRQLRSTDGAATR